MEGPILSLKFRLMVIPEKVKILIVEDHDSVSLGLIRYLEENSGQDFMLSKTSNVPEAIKAIEQGPFDVILLYFFLKSNGKTNGDGDELLFHLRKMEQPPKVIVYSKSDSLEILDYLVEHLQVDGFILKSRGSLEEVIPAIEMVLDGGHYFSPSINRLLRFHMGQLEIDYIDRMMLKAISQGMKQVEIRDFLANYGKRLSLSGIEKRIKRLKLRFEATTVSEVVAIALRKGLI